MIQDLKIALRLAVGMIVLAEALALTGIVTGPMARSAGTLTSSHWVFNIGSMGLHATLLFAVYSTPNWRLILGVLLGGAALDIVLLPQVPAPPPENIYYWLCTLSAGPGLISFAGLLAGWWRGSGARRRDFAALLGALLLLELYGLGLGPYLDLTAALHPTTFDSAAYRIDASLGFSPSATVAMVVASHGAIDSVLLMSYHVLAYAFSLIYALQVKSRLHWPASVFMITTVSGAVALALYQLCPIAGPGYAFADTFPFGMNAAETYSLAATAAPGAARNGMPSMHFGWALLLWFNARDLHPVLRNAFALLLGLTFLATLGLGEHYLIDLIAGVPAALAMQALCTRILPWRHPARRDAIVTGFALTFAWIAAVRFFGQAFADVPGLTWALTIVTIALSARCYSRLWQAWPPQAALVPGASAPALPVLERRQLRVAIAMFLISGFAGLMYQVLFSKALALTFGSTSTATYTVLATYMGGMALGAWIGGWLTERRADVLRLYGFCELGIGLFCLATPAVFAAIQNLYVGAASGIAPDAGMLTVFRVALGAIALAVPTMLMGMTLPLLAKFIGERGGSLGASVAMLYGANTLGAAFGALLAGYLVIPALGIYRTTLLAAAANLLVALLAIRLHKAWAARPDLEATVMPVPQPAGAAQRALGVLAIVLLTVGGFITLALEVNYIHLLAVVAGNSVYAFALMLFTFLLGLGAGAEAGRRLLSARVSLPVALAMLEFGLAGVILAGDFLWDGLPRYFASFGGYALTQGFGAREFVRGIVCWLAMFPVAFFIGALYPVAMECVGRAFPQRRFAALGEAAALNTAGNILGVLVAGFLMLPALGALYSLKILAAVSFALGALALAFSERRRSLVAWLPAAVVVALLLAQPRSFDYSELASGANVYFQRQGYGAVIDHAESVDGGLTTVAENRRGQARTLTLLTNGKFQGNDDVKGEMPAQVGFAVAPLLHTTARERALVIGYGTGVSARTMNDAGFRNVEIVDLSADIVRMADRYFGSVNGGVTKRPGVATYITDGRNFLMLQNRSYDIISMEISSIWFAGAASLYNQEFYRLVKRRLKQDGVLQQWMQLHHLEALDMLHILGSVRAEFRHVWLYFIGDQGIIVASNDAARAPGREAFALLERTASFQPLLQILRHYAQDIFDTLVLDPAGTDAFLAGFAQPPSRWVSTDDNLFLEYHTPRGNVLDGKGSLEENLALLRKFGVRAK